MTLRTRIILIIIFFVCQSTFCNAQKLTFRCIEQYQKSGNSNDSIIIQTCFLNAFKFVTTSYPDYAGRYTFSEHKVFVLKNQNYFETNNSDVFNDKQNDLVKIINDKIQEDFKTFSTEKNTKDCFIGVDSIPIYTMNDFDISFNQSEIWFGVNWGLSSACRSVDGTIVSYKVSKLKKYLK